MPTSDPINILLSHDQWATGQMLEACSKLTPEQFHQRFDIGPGSLHDTLMHMLAAMRAWGDILAGREQRPRLEGTHHAIEELRSLLIEIAGDFAATAKAHPLNETISRTRDGKTLTFTRAAVITHLATHGMHHRAQCLNMLKQLGVKPLPPSSVTDWSQSADPMRS